MLDRIQNHMFNLLAEDTRLLTGGFPDVKRVYDGDIPAATYINLFDWALEDDSKEARPGIYFGLRNSQASDRSEGDLVSVEGLIRRRVAIIPIVIVCQSTSRKTAKDTRNQLVANVRAVLSDPENLVQDAYWWLLEEKTSQSSFRNSGGGTLNANEARTIITYEASYTYVSGQVTV